jgi:hypothetical protein
MSRTAFQGLVESLRSAVERLTWEPTGTEWCDYYSVSGYGPVDLERKKRFLSASLDRTAPPPAIVWDLGANTGHFSRVAGDRDILTVSLDIDPAAVEINYLESLSRGDRCILPLVVDIANPSPGLGWANRERMSLLERGPADVLFALALIHHLAISNNLPMGQVADLFSRLCRTLIIEFIPKSDPQVQRLLSSRKDIFAAYNQESFEQCFGHFFRICSREPLPESGRVLYRMENAR